VKLSAQGQEGRDLLQPFQYDTVVLSSCLASAVRCGGLPLFVLTSASSSVLWKESIGSESPRRSSKGEGAKKKYSAARARSRSRCCQHQSASHEAAQSASRWSPAASQAKKSHHHSSQEGAPLAREECGQCVVVAGVVAVVDFLLARPEGVASLSPFITTTSEQLSLL